jgi:hypothetical protein
MTLLTCKSARARAPFLAIQISINYAWPRHAYSQQNIHSGILLVAVLVLPQAGLGPYGPTSLVLLCEPGRLPLEA